MDEALKLESVRRWITAFTEAMEAEAVLDGTRRRVLNRVLFGNPDGDVFAKASLAVEDAVAAMDPETLRGFQVAGLSASAEEAGWRRIPKKVAVTWRKHTVEHRCDDTCVCPNHGTPLLWSRHHDLHACQDPACRYAHGLESHPDYEVIELLRNDDQRRHLFEGHLPNPERTDRGR